MNQKFKTKRNIDDLSSYDELSYWKKRSHEERITAVETLRRQYQGYLQNRIEYIIESGYASMGHKQGILILTTKGLT